MATSDKRARAYDFLSDFIEQAPEAAAKALLSAAFNVMTADDFVSMVEDEFEWEDEDETDDPDTDEDDDDEDEERHIVGYDEDGDPILELGPDEPGQVPAQDE